MPLPRLRPPIIPLPRRRSTQTPTRPPTRPSKKVVNRRAVARLRKQYRRLQQESYEMGVALRALKRTDVVAQYGETSFRVFIDKHVMPFTTAHRCMFVSENFTKATATKLGMRKAQLLHRYVEVAKLRTSAEQLAKVDRKIGSPGKVISERSTRDLELLIQQTKMQSGKAKIPKPTAKIKRAVAEMKAQFIERFGVVPTVRIDMKRNVVELEIPLSAAGEIVGSEE